MRKKWFVIFIAFLSVLFVSACNGDSDSNKLSGKTFKVAYTPALQEDSDDPSNYKPIMKLNFSDDNAVTNTMGDEEGTYELNEDMLVISFENESEKLKIEFVDFKDSDEDFSTYSTSIGDAELKVEDNEQVSHLKGLSSKISKDMPIEFIEEE